MNLKRVVFTEDWYPYYLTDDFSLVKKFFKGLGPNHSTDDATLSWSEISAVYLFIYDDRYSVERDMWGDLLIYDEEKDEMVEQEHWYDRVPWLFYCQPLNLKEFLALNPDCFNSKRY